jgi:transposase-like protein
MVMAQKSAKTMTCKACDVVCQRFGKHRNGLARFRCPNCKKTYTEPHRLTLGEMYVSEEKALLAVQLLIEGNSIRSTQRITGVDQNTIMKILTLAGDRCEKLMGRLIVNVPVKDVEADEIWAFVKKKEGHKMPHEENNNSIGHAYCFVAIRTQHETGFELRAGTPRHCDNSDIHRRTSDCHCRSEFPDHHRWIRALRSCHLRHPGRPRELRSTHQGLPLPARRREALQPR